MIVYIDTSALVKRYIQEANSGDVVTLLDQADLTGTILLTRVEMASAFSKAVRMKWLDLQAAEESWQDFLVHWRSFSRLVVSQPLTDRASRLAWDYGLCAYDATHLAAALLWQETLETPVTLTTYDRELWLAGQKAGLLVWPENLAS
jgi:predicted nucleic acid-binding protein